MRLYFRYLLHLLRHKRRVMGFCLEQGPYWQGLTHDLSKFLPDEFLSSALFFAKQKMTAEETERARIGLLRHYHRNPHHPEHWVVNPAEGRALKMPRRYLLELVCDWRAVGPGDLSSTRAWYLENRQRFVFHPETRAELERLLHVPDEMGGST